MARSAAAMPTITTTVTVDEPSLSSRGGTTALILLRLNRRLDDGEGDRNRNRKKVSWKEGTVDNEFMQRKSSKKCCVFHKEKPFDEDISSDEEEDVAGGGHRRGCC
ncbi:hypothetical protein MLD38_023187 [Melastoma candidum]|uniref:Uncharacterized protein n=1 Tax=Melastoma candidum TaxID=119954 RepID=A0ACB9QLQ8_9MYRT|nr:hypothetical protein MLD38_023187 [Melastoma candidum]